MTRLGTLAFCRVATAVANLVADGQLTSFEMAEVIQRLSENQSVAPRREYTEEEELLILEWADVVPSRKQKALIALANKLGRSPASIREKLRVMQKESSKRS